MPLTTNWTVASYFTVAETRAEVDEFYRSADVFFFPSYREPGGNVMFEAMSWGLPLIVSSKGGPGVAVDDTCGFRVTPIAPEQFARDLAAAARPLIENRELRLSLGEAARARVAQIAVWDNKFDQMGALYESVLRRGPPQVAAH